MKLRKIMKELKTLELLNPPTQKELWAAHCEDSEDIESVQINNDTSYRHGCYVTEVFFRKTDATFWRINYTVDGTGDHNSLRDEKASVDVGRVMPEIVKETRYVPFRE